MKKTIYLLIAFCSCLASCKKDNTTTNTGTIVTGDVIVVNQGQYKVGDASATLFDPSTKKVTADLFNSVNNRPLGDVAQSMLVNNGKGYIVLNNSAKIEVVDMSSFKSLGTIKIAGSSPRYILPVGGSKAYVTDYYSGIVTIIDLDAYTVTGTINVGGETEQMAIANGKAYILNIINGGATSLKIVDPNSNAVTDSINLSLQGGAGLVKDGSGNLWVLCSPYDTTYTLQSGIIKISTASNTVSQTLSYPSPATQNGFSNITVAPDGNTLLFLGPLGAYKMTTSGSQLPTTAFISQGTHSFYGIGVDNTSSNVYLGDGGNFATNSKVFSYNLSSGSPVDSFAAGIAPCFFAFK